MLNPAYPRQSRFVVRISTRLKLLLNPKFYFALIFPTLVILSIVQMIASNRLATQGEDIRTIEKRKQALTQENRQLETEIARESSISSLEDKVKQLNMKKVDKTVVVQDPVVAALP